MKLRDEETGQLYECEYACDGINQDRYIKTGRMVVEDRSKWHPHHDLIVAWARGAEIEYFDDDDCRWHKKPQIPGGQILNTASNQRKAHQGCTKNY